MIKSLLVFLTNKLKVFQNKLITIASGLSGTIMRGNNGGLNGIIGVILSKKILLIGI
ncbi:hypothetical protein [Helicobacter pylori]|uniref:hypothetical protein n=1 Tax=Helicobacter pylori TaxID=210 RepID=UPI0039DF4446